MRIIPFFIFDRPKDNLAIQIEEALTVRQHAEDKLNQTSDPELVDAAVYDLKAADLRLNYLLRQSRQVAV